MQGEEGPGPEQPPRPPLQSGRQGPMRGRLVKGWPPGGTCRGAGAVRRSRSRLPREGPPPQTEDISQPRTPVNELHVKHWCARSRALHRMFDPTHHHGCPLKSELNASNCRELLSAGFAVRAGVRDLEKAEGYLDVAATYGLLSPDQLKRVALVPFDLKDPSTFEAALGNANKVGACLQHGQGPWPCARGARGTQGTCVCMSAGRGTAGAFPREPGFAGTHRRPRPSWSPLDTTTRWGMERTVTSAPTTGCGTVGALTALLDAPDLPPGFPERLSVVGPPVTLS